MLTCLVLMHLPRHAPCAGSTPSLYQGATVVSCMQVSCTRLQAQGPSGCAALMIIYFICIYAGKVALKQELTWLQAAQAAHNGQSH
jgi:hypothetical protein